LQVRASLAPDATLFAIEAFYLPQNLVAFVRNVRAAPGRTHDKPGGTTTTTMETSQTALRLSWDVENQDVDKLRYRVSYRREGHDRFLPILRDDEVLEKNELAIVAPPSEIHSFTALTDDTISVTIVGGKYKPDRKYYNAADKTYVVRQPKQTGIKQQAAGA